MAARRQGRDIHCTYDDSRGGKVKARQEWRECQTCAEEWSGEDADFFRCCAICAAQCHAGHRLGQVYASRMVCDCGGGRGGYGGCVMRREKAKAAASR